jgi:hypothetical protein
LSPILDNGVFLVRILAAILIAIVVAIIVAVFSGSQVKPRGD